jgi:hypothetical protein
VTIGGGGGESVRVWGQPGLPSPCGLPQLGPMLEQATFILDVRVDRKTATPTCQDFIVHPVRPIPHEGC